MRKTWKLTALGLIPLAAGYILDAAMRYLVYLPVTGRTLVLVEIGCLFLWGYLAYRVSAPEKNAITQAFLLCAVGLLMLALVLYQELIMGQYWPDIIGFSTQIYFLPLLTLASAVFTPVVQWFAPVIRIWPFYIAIWACMFAVSCAGCLRRRKRT